MEKLKNLSRAVGVIKNLQEQNKVKTLTFKESANLNNELATKMKQINAESEVREKNSRAAVAKMELGSYRR